MSKTSCVLTANSASDSAASLYPARAKAATELKYSLALTPYAEAVLYACFSMTFNSALVAPVTFATVINSESTFFISVKACEKPLRTALNAALPSICHRTMLFARIVFDFSLAAATFIVAASAVIAPELYFANDSSLIFPNTLVFSLILLMPCAQSGSTF